MGGREKGEEKEEESAHWRWADGSQPQARPPCRDHGVAAAADGDAASSWAASRLAVGLVGFALLAAHWSLSFAKVRLKFTCVPPRLSGFFLSLSLPSLCPP